MNIKSLKLGSNSSVTLSPITMRNMVKVSTRCLKIVKPLTSLLGVISNEEDEEEVKGSNLGGVPLEKIGDVLAEVITAVDDDELIELFFYLVKGCTCESGGAGIFKIESIDDIDKFRELNITDLGVFILEALKYNNFPFLNKVNIDFSSAIERIGSIAEDLTKDKK